MMACWGGYSGSKTVRGLSPERVMDEICGHPGKHGVLFVKSAGSVLDTESRATIKRDDAGLSSNLVQKES
jgi:hypothetical protein